jgi:hypothetical protein
MAGDYGNGAHIPALCTLHITYLNAVEIYVDIYAPIRYQTAI